MTKTDRDQVQELLITYFACVDAGDFDGLGDCFVSDAEATYNSNVCTGRDAIVGLTKHRTVALDAMQHYVTNFVVDIDGDTARMTAHILAQHVRYNTPGGDAYLVGGRYNVEARRIGGKWKIARIKAASAWGDGNPAVFPYLPHAPDAG